MKRAFPRFTAALAIVASVFWCAAPALAQQPLQWSYGFDGNGNAQAAYPGNLTAGGNVSIGGNLTVTGSFAQGIVTASCGTVTVSTPCLNLAQTWNNSGATFTGALFNVTDTASNAASLLLDLQVSGVSKFSVGKSGAISATGSLALPSAASVAWNSDSFLVRDAANTLAQRNGANAQAFNYYNTFTDASNYERGYTSWSGNLFRVGVSASGTGTQRPLSLETSGTSRWQVSTGGTLAPAADATTDLGSSSSRVRNIGFSGHLGNMGATTGVNLTSCGTSPSLGANSSDTAGKINVGTGTVTSCTLNFGTAYTSNVGCIVADVSAPSNISSWTTGLTNIVINFAASSPSHNIVYICLGV